MNKNEKLLNSIGNINDTYIQEATLTVSKRKNNKRWLIPMAASFALTIALSVGYMTLTHDNTPVPEQVPGNIAGITDTSPMGPRKIINYNGFRYVYDNKLIPEQYIELGEELATISADLSIDPQGLATQDLAGTFAPGSKIHAVVGYSENFRIAVSDETGVYVCQVTDTVPAGELNLESFFKNINLIPDTEELAVFDHHGREFLKEIGMEDAQKLLTLISTATKAELSNDDYQEIGSMQVNGKSFSLECKLTGGSVYQFYAIPEKGLVMIGDNTYQVSPDAQSFLASLLNI